MRAAPVLIALSLLVAPTAFAQPGQDQMMAAGQSLETSMAAAQAAAARPGDEHMTCDAIQSEMIMTMNDPAMQAQIASLGQWAQSRQNQAQDARSAMSGMAMSSIIGGLASSFIPGAGYAQSLAMQAQISGMQAQADANNRESAAMMGGVENMMPQMMRGQRLYELAEAQECAFLQEMAAPQ
ncbi:hypothetical protein U91I_04200 [alpha proteobacterium U9-1i]|nr:hypothetical protein U91I_04200 [alpha proteobacterium U9-1i]